jgi:hypothetical protein
MKDQNLDSIKYAFINVDVLHEMCDVLKIVFLMLNKSRDVKEYNDKYQQKMSRTPSCIV